MSKLSNSQIFDEEISIGDIINFLIGSWKSILTVGVVGFLGALSFIWVMPSQYEAKAHIKLTQIYAYDKSNGLVKNLETPSSLIARFKIPSVFTLDDASKCGFVKSKSPQEDLVKFIKILPIKDAENIIELRVRSESKEQAIACVRVIYEVIRKSQDQIMESYIEGPRTLLRRYEARIKTAQSFIVDEHLVNPEKFTTYLVKRNELNLLEDEMFRLELIIASVDNHHAKIYSSIFASETPVFPNKQLILIFGLLAGLFLGPLLVLGRKAWRNYQACKQYHCNKAHDLNRF